MSEAELSADLAGEWGVPTLVPGLPGPLYCDPAFFDKERSLLWGRSWVCIGRGAEIDRPGRFLQRMVAGESVIVVRGNQGQATGFLNLCRHRGARLCLEPEGQLGPYLRCPYHGWTYGQDGRLVGIPNLREVPDLARADYGLHRVALAEWLGCLWANLDTDAPSLSHQVDPQLRARFGDAGALRRYGLEDLVVGHRQTYDVAANWKTLVENFTECYHCPTLHPELTQRIPEFTRGYGTVTGGTGHGALLAQGLEGFSWSGRPVGPPLPGLGPADWKRFYGVILLPNVFLILVPDHVVLYRLEPVSACLTVVDCAWLFPPDTAGQPGFDPSDAVRIVDLTNRQDFEACERCQLGMSSRRFSHGLLVPAERLIAGFHEYVLRMTGEGGGNLAPRSAGPASG
jgi:Rieske 2Fe-2S family protein